MTDKQLKLIYEYMGWCEHDYTEILIDPDDGSKIYTEYICFKCKRPFIDKKIEHPFDSNSAWEVVQEMERKGYWENFYYLAEENNFVDIDNRHNIFSWLMNPENFFNCFAKWLEGRVL